MSVIRQPVPHHRGRGEMSDADDSIFTMCCDAGEVMKGSRRLCCGVLAACMLVCSGCASTTELTSDEQDIITMYAGKVVAKHNVRLAQGLVRYRARNLTTGEEEEEAEDVTETQEEEAQETPSVDSSSSADASAETTPEEEAIQTVSLTEALNIEGISFTYKDAAVYKDVQAANAYVEEPAEGNRYVGLTFTATNTTNKDIDVSLLTRQTTFTATIGSESKNAKPMTMLLNDLPTFVGTITQGSSEDLVVYFEFSKKAVRKLSSISLSANVDGQNYQIALR